MAEEEEKQEVQEEDTSVSIVEEARSIRDEILKAKEDLKKENDRQEKIQARNMLGGKSNMTTQKEEPKEETPEEYKNKVMRGEL